MRPLAVRERDDERTARTRRQAADPECRFSQGGDSSAAAVLARAPGPAGTMTLQPAAGTSTGGGRGDQPTWMVGSPARSGVTGRRASGRFRWWSGVNPCRTAPDNTAWVRLATPIFAQPLDHGQLLVPIEGTGVGSAPVRARIRPRPSTFRSPRPACRRHQRRRVRGHAAAPLKTPRRHARTANPPSPASTGHQLAVRFAFPRRGRADSPPAADGTSASSLARAMMAPWSITCTHNRSDIEAAAKRSGRPAQSRSGYRALQVVRRIGV